jgi:hypothetical protein
VVGGCDEGEGGCDGKDCVGGEGCFDVGEGVCDGGEGVLDV